LVRGYQIERYGVVQQGFDGRVGWSETPEYAIENLTGNRLTEIRREAQFDWALRLKELYPGLAVRGRATILERETVEAAARLPEGGEAKLSFDAETGLLTCVEAPETARDGSSRTVRICYDDYRGVNGVQVPHTIHYERSDLMWIVRRTVAYNVPVDGKRFLKP
jgi:hypothetical protein